MDEINELLKTILDNDELWKLSAKICRKSFNALIAEGFTPDQAIRIVAVQAASSKNS